MCGINDPIMQEKFRTCAKRILFKNQPVNLIKKSRRQRWCKHVSYKRDKSAATVK